MHSKDYSKNMSPGSLNLITPGIAVIIAVAIILGYYVAGVIQLPLIWVGLAIFLVLFFVWKPKEAADYEPEKPEKFNNTWVTLEAHNAEDLKIATINDDQYFEITGKSKMFPGKSLIRLNLHLKENTQHIELMQSDYFDMHDMDRVTDDDGSFKVKFKKFPQTTKVLFGENETVIWEA